MSGIIYLRAFPLTQKEVFVVEINKDMNRIMSRSCHGNDVTQVPPTLRHNPENAYYFTIVVQIGITLMQFFYYFSEDI